MPKFVLDIECGNAAFEGDRLIVELKRLLKFARWQVGQYRVRPDRQTSCDLVDRNGNRVGKWTFHPDVEVTSDDRPYSELTELETRSFRKHIPSCPGSVSSPTEFVGECAEIAEGIRMTGLEATIQSCRERVRWHMPDETQTVVDNVAEALLVRLRRTLRGNGLL